MDTWLRRTLVYIVALGGIILGYAFAYDYGMAAFENDPQPFLRSLRVVVETFTTTGYGSDAPWSTTEMRLLVIVMDITGVVLIFLALPVLLFPLFEEAMETTAPNTVENGLSDHVVICQFSPRGETLVTELDTWDVDYVIVEPDRDRANDLYEDGYYVIHADPQSVDGLERAHLSSARALVADASDQVNTSIILTAREVDESVQTVSVVKEPDRAKYHDLAGADAVLSPRGLLGESLASKVTTGISTTLGDSIEIGEDFDIAELPIHRGSDLVGTTLADSGIREETGVNVIGAWFRGQFVSPPDPESELDGSTVLLVSGTESQLEQLKQMTLSSVRGFRRGETVIIGAGEVGQTITSALTNAGVPHTVLDQADAPGVDVVGDATEPEELRHAGVGTARTVILALSSDTDTEFATLVIRDLNPDVEIIARAEESENVQKMYRAGADYVLALSTVSGRMLASTILEDEDVISMDQQVEVIRVAANSLGNTTLGEADVRSRTGCTVVAIERNGTVVTDLGPDVTIEPSDKLVIAGTDDGVTRFKSVFG
ncbi:metal transporter [Haloarcula taiwanensis]|uniref:Metal transporter n=1 Tax=Haloarcula taiwanensis TaxID=1932004 RepID=A0A2H5A1N5_9EURY|nr:MULTISPECIES: NAD-binding protein [Haloarcula]AUG48634.1 metal transporter [Haloarcula taiwanensis]RLM39965.1 TrkA family potassium uptake protein [Haloarcula sp. Atlit-120R]RLM47975.1 TrkA family potassium uptake protein [Haloarcula sp. Atlit-47R]RLM96381.1 TrkA family potassium uptake protein [Haloarcula sp. Atlit-7R]